MFYYKALMSVFLCRRAAAITLHCRTLLLSYCINIDARPEMSQRIDSLTTPAARWADTCELVRLCQVALNGEKGRAARTSYPHNNCFMKPRVGSLNYTWKCDGSVWWCFFAVSLSDSLTEMIQLWRGCHCSVIHFIL